MPLGMPIEFNLYGDDDEVIGHYSRARIPLSFAERAIELNDSLSSEAAALKQLDALYQIVVDFYGGKFTFEQLHAGADLGELIAVIRSIAMRAVELMPPGNPTQPGK